MHEGDGWSIAFEHETLAACSDRALVLTSLEIPHQVVEQHGRHYLIVPEAEGERARFELWEYEQENRKPAPSRPVVLPQEHDGRAGVVVYLGAIGFFAWAADTALFGRDWLAAGRMDGALFRGGEVWRSVTALTLHLDLRHLLGNMGFGSLFGYFAGRLVGSGVSWLAIVISAALANGLNTVLLDPAHRSIGASTAVFAALGLLSGYVWRGKLMAQERWPYRLGPIIGGAALLAFTGTGGENTDIGAHLMGYLSGLVTGMVLVGATPTFSNERLQWTSGALAVGLLLCGWSLALAL